MALVDTTTNDHFPLTVKVVSMDQDVIPPASLSRPGHHPREA